ncbi:MAG: hypothetical protein ACYSOK_07075 [Planctomycetota bacterium]|jgi:hypothetical protein
MEPTSEQELKQLLEEGKITEQEYQELLEAIRQKETVQKPLDVPQKPTEPKPRTGYGKAALILMIIGLLSPLVPLIYHLIMNMRAANESPRFVMLTGCPFLFLGFVCFLLAFIFGIIGWKTPQGKIAAIGVPCLGFLIVPGLVVLFFVGVRVQHQVADDMQYGIQSFVSHKRYPLDSMVGVLTQDGVQFDMSIDHNNSIDGRASLKITSDSAHKQVIRLFETGPVDVEDRMLIYLAQLQSDLSKGQAYLEMWCEIQGKGEFFSKGLEQPISGKTNWTMLKTPFRLEAGQSPSNVKLNLVIEGTGAVWIDGVVLGSNSLN